MGIKQNKNLIRGFYPIVDVSYSPHYNPFKMAELVLSSGVGLLQLRQKNLTEQEFLNSAKEIAYLRIHNKFKCIINHFVDVARAIEADGVHLGSTSVSIKEARKILGDEVIIGASVHSVEEGILKEKEGADYITFGAIYPTSTKGPDHPVQGVEKLQELVSKVSIPVVAIGGITLERVSDVIKAGASAYTAITAVSRSEDPVGVAKRFVACL